MYTVKGFDHLEDVSLWKSELLRGSNEDSARKFSQGLDVGLDYIAQGRLKVVF